MALVNFFRELAIIGKQQTFWEHSKKLLGRQIFSWADSKKKLEGSKNILGEAKHVGGAKFFGGGAGTGKNLCGAGVTIFYSELTDFPTAMCSAEISEYLNHPKV